LILLPLNSTSMALAFSPLGSGSVFPTTMADITVAGFGVPITLSVTTILLSLSELPPSVVIAPSFQYSISLLVIVTFWLRAHSIAGVVFDAVGVPIR